MKTGSAVLIFLSPFRFFLYLGAVRLAGRRTLPPIMKSFLVHGLIQNMKDVERGVKRQVLLWTDIGLITIQLTVLNQLTHPHIQLQKNGSIL